MTVEDLWRLFEEELETGRCGCGCSWNGKLWMYRHPDMQDWELYEHTSGQRTTAIDNHMIHFMEGWSHEGRNPFYKYDGTWVNRRRK